MNRSIDLSERLYRGLTRLYPRSHRDAYGEEMVRLFRDLCRDAVARRGILGLISAWAFVLRDLVGSVIGEHRTEGRKTMMTLYRAIERRCTSATFMKELSQAFLWVTAISILIGSVLKLTALPLTEGQLVIGLLCACAVSLQLVVLGVLAEISRTAPGKQR